MDDIKGNRNQLIATLTRWEQIGKRIDHKIEVMRRAGVTLEIVDDVWEVHDEYTKALCRQFGIPEDESWLEWYAFDNDFGRAQRDAGFDTTKPIKGVEDLADLIEEEVRRGVW